ncbi:aldo/keto reductase [Rhizobium sp. RU36D]|uniref:aldo/keto reductase n=1 Tax=Rhizobium sp. RU36D TaxID=1907415 RepID=UPI000A018DA9|nr:aldo/keto reductase [Rhizobium sp. RU36D]
MGCASLGSRISANDGLRFLNEAYSNGVRWFDVAPAYGAGQAEQILSEFLTGRRHEMRICSKVGLLPPRGNSVFRNIYEIARPIAQKAGGLRRFYRSLSATRNVKVPLSPAIIVSSLENSLRRLRTDYIDVFALHDPSAVDVAREEILRCLEDCISKGFVRYVSVAGDEEAVAVAARVGLPFSVFQFANPLGSSLPEKLTQIKGTEPAMVTHSVLGLGAERDRLLALSRTNPDLERSIRDAGYTGHLNEVVSNFLIGRAFVRNPNGVVLLSMFSPGRAANAAKLTRISLSAGSRAIYEKLEMLASRKDSNNDS